MSQTENNGGQQPSDGPAKLTPDEVEQWRDMLWAVQDPEVKAHYADKVVAVYHRRIIASGDDEETVLAEAERITGLPRHKIPVTTILGPGILFSPRD